MKQAYIAVIEEFILSGGCLELGDLRNKLEYIGIVDSIGKIVDHGRLERMLRLAEAPIEEQSAALQLPKTNPLRLFYEHSLANQSDETRQILALVRRHTQPITKSEPFQPGHAKLPARTNHGLGGKLFEHFLSTDALDGCLGRPAHRMPPERIVWPVRLDLACGFEAQLSEAERHKHEAYQMLIQDTPDAGEKILGLGIPASSIPAMRAWLSRTGSPPPVLPGLFQLHIGKSRIRANLFCASKSALLPAFTERFRTVANPSGLFNELIVDGPHPGREVKETFSAARLFNLPETLTEADTINAIQFTKETWSALKKVLLVCSAK
jgi:hypothetical protein